MKPFEATLILRLLALLVLIVTSIAQAADDNTPVPQVTYDKATDQLNVTAESTSLKMVLGRIAFQSGIEVLFDDAANEPVSIEIESVSLEDGIKQILKGRNHVLSYDRDKEGKRLLVGAMVLPAGEQDTGKARRLMPIDEEAYYRAQSQLSVEQAQQVDMASQRWQKRLDKMPTKQRETMEKRVNDRLVKEALRKQQRKERHKNQREQRAKREQERRQREETMLQRLSPEQRELYEQRRKASDEEIRKMLEINQ